MRKYAKQVAEKIAQQGHLAWFAGGCVRDRLLGIEPKDYDIATDATPEQVLEVFPKARTVGAHFGVVLVKNHGIDFEIATFREDGVYEDGRRPEEVVFSNPETDAQRRDFTINGLFEKPETGEIVDYVGGQADLKNRILRAIGNPHERFTEDHLRMLRAVRFSTRLGFEIETDTWASVVANAEHLARISPERIRDEFDRILTGPDRERGFDLLIEGDLMRSIIPEILKLKDCQQPPQFHPEGDVLDHVRLMLELSEDEPHEVLLAVLLHDIAKPATQEWSEEKERFTFNGHAAEGAVMAEEILRRLRYSNQVVDAVVESVANHMKFMDVQKMRRSTLRRFMGRPRFDEEMMLHRLDCLGSHGGLDNHAFLQRTAEDFASEPVMPAALLNGRDLIGRGWKPGPQLGEILREIQTRQLEGELNSADEAWAWLETQETEQ